MAKRQKKEITYQTAAEARENADGIPVFCAFDKLADPKELKGNPKNPNQHSKDQIELLAHIIQSQGWRAPITVSTRSGFVVRGHGRLAAALFLKAKQVPVDYQNYANDAEEWADLVADNRLSELSEIDTGKLADLIEEMDTGEIPLSLTGYDEEEIADLLAALSGDDDPEADGTDDAEETAEIPVLMTKPGDLWILGNHRILCGSATDRDAVKKLMDGEKAHMVFTDPPYGVSYVSQSGKFEALENDDKRGDTLVQELLLPALKNAVEFTIDEAGFYIWYAFASRQDFYYAMTAAGLQERQEIIWAKAGFVLGHADYQWGHEPCFYCSKAGCRPRFFGDRSQKTVWHVTRRASGYMEATLKGGITLTDGQGSKMHITDKLPKDKKTRYLRVGKDKSVFLYAPGTESTIWEVSRENNIEHPTQKPVELATRAIENSSQEGEIILDLFGGSGTTLIGAEQMRRKARLMEIDPKYVDIAVNRYVRLTGNGGAVCIRDGKEIPYGALKTECDRANGNEPEVR